MTLKRLSFLAVVLFVAAPLYAQGGCVQSPEAPTDVLMVVGAAGAFYGSRLLSRFAARRGNSGK